MGAFFFALFGIIWLCIVYGKEYKSDQQYQAQVQVQKTRAQLWYDRVDSGPIRNRMFHEKMKGDPEFRKSVEDYCNSVVKSIPEMNGMQLIGWYSCESRRVMEMIYNAQIGNVSFMWHPGYIKAYDLTSGFLRKPSPQECQPLINWYQEELRRNGYQDATIYPIKNSYNILVGWRFADGAYTYEQIKMALFL